MLKSQKSNWDWISIHQKTSPSNDYAFWGTVVGIVIIGGTVVEDFLSGGIGVTDDAASFALAYKLIFG